MTCKKKRLKCDETKPTCVQCEKRNVECEGYKKDYKWRSFEETNKTSRAGKGKKADGDKKVGDDIPRPPPNSRNDSGTLPKEEHSNQEREGSFSPGLQHAFTSATQAFSGPPPSRMSPARASSPRGRYSPSQFEPLPILHPGFSPSDFDLPPLPDSLNHSHRHREDLDSHPRSFSPGSPDLVNLLLPGTDLRRPPDLSEPRPPMSPLPYQPGSDDERVTPEPLDRNNDEDFDEEIVRNGMNSQFHEDMPSAWTQRCPSPARSDASTTSSKSTDLTLLRAPRMEPSSPEMLMCRFFQETCGILSVKDGPSENPWRDLVVDLGHGCEALSHAISSMSALHGATRNKSLRSAGIGHMNKSIRRLQAGMSTMNLEQALATSLALALGEGWDERISTGVTHLKGAKLMLSAALGHQDRSRELGLVSVNGAKRMKFLCNTYVYLDVIARLTSLEDDPNPLDLSLMLELADRPFRSNLNEIDPLMGCATTLFPLIGEVGTLIRQVRKTQANSLSIIDEANNLREQILEWKPPDRNYIDEPEDPNSRVQHAIHTAEAYRLAVLLHLYQAVPELASEPHTIANNIMRILAGVPLSSNTVIVQIYPLLVGSCEMVSREDREFATKRWEAMVRRLNIMNVTSCWDIVREVWARRDEYLQQQQHLPGLKRKTTMPESRPDQFFADGGHTNQGFFVQHDDRPPTRRRLTFDVPGPDMMSQRGRQTTFTNRRSADAPISNIEPEYTVRGHLHWLAVMQERQWEGELYKSHVAYWHHYG